MGQVVAEKRFRLLRQLAIAVKRIVRLLQVFLGASELLNLLFSLLEGERSGLVLFAMGFPFIFERGGAILDAIQLGFQRLENVL